MKNQKAIIWVVAVVVIIALAIAWPKVSSVFKAGEAQYPAKDITMVVPYNPGGGTDLTVRAVADEMGKALGKNISVVNTPGASGSLGTLNVLNAPHDGYNIIGNGFLSFVTYPVMGYTEKTHRDWHIWIATFSPNVIAVKADSKYQDINALIKGIKDNPGTVSFGTAGIGTGGHIAGEVLKAALGINYKHVPYQGGNPAIIAAISGEVDAVPQLSMEMVDMIRSKKLKPLAAMTDKPLNIDGADKIPGIAELVQDPALRASVPLGEAFGIAVPKDTPDAVVKKIDEAFKKAIASESVKKFGKEKGVDLLALSGEESQKYVEKLASTVDWALFEGGVAKISPEKFNIKKPVK